jgi:dolichol kinase
VIISRRTHDIIVATFNFARIVLPFTFDLTKIVIVVMIIGSSAAGIAGGVVHGVRQAK